MITVNRNLSQLVYGDDFEVNGEWFRKCAMVSDNQFEAESIDSNGDVVGKPVKFKWNSLTGVNAIDFMVEVQSKYEDVIKGRELSKREKVSILLKLSVNADLSYRSFNYLERTLGLI